MSAIRLRVVKDMKAIQKDFRTLNEKVVAEAAVSAQNRTANTISGLAIKETAKSLKILAQALRGSKKKGIPRRVIVQRASRTRRSAAITVLTVPVAFDAAFGARSRSRALKSRGAVNVQGETLSGSRFLLRSRRGRMIIAARRSEDRLPVSEARAPIRSELKSNVEKLLFKRGPEIFADHFRSRLKERLRMGKKS